MLLFFLFQYGLYVMYLLYRISYGGPVDCGGRAGRNRRESIAIYSKQSRVPFA